LQNALRQLAQAAGFTLIEPRQNDAFDDNRHRMTQSYFNAPSPEYRGRIAAVRQRGLEQDGRVIEKAWVSLYD
jgi:hypothetical protein